MIAPETRNYECREFDDPLTGRRWTQLTSGEEFCYPLYYFGPVVTADGKTVLFYRYHQGEVQNWKLDLDTGQATQLTHASTPNCLWRFWDEPERAHGVRDLMSAFSEVSEELAYFDGNVLRAVHVRTLNDRAVHELPEDRVPCGIPGLSPSGERFVFMHADRAWWEASTRNGTPLRHEARGVRLDVIDMQTGCRRTLVTINSWLTHANFYDEQRIVFAQLPTENSILMTDLRGGWYVAMRTQTPEGIVLNHAVVTRRGIQYETVSPLPHGIIGHCHPETFASRDYLTDYPIAHVGHDWQGRLWFGDIYELDPPHARHLAWLPRVRVDEVNPFTMLTQGFQMHGNPRVQRCHVHASLMPDRRHILFTGPDESTPANHLFLLDVSDLAGTETDIVYDGVASSSPS